MEDLNNEGQPLAETPVTDIAALPPAERALIVLGSTRTEIALRDLVTEAASITAVVDDNGRKQAHAVGMKLVKARTTIEKTGKAAREDANAFVKSVLAEERRLIAITEAEEKRVLGLRNAYDQKKEEEARERAAAEAKRVEGIKAKIAQIRAIPLSMAGASSGDIADELQALNGFDPTDAVFAEFTDDAKAALKEVTATLGELHARVVAQEDAAAEIEAERKRVAEAERIAAEKLAAERAQFEAERAALQAERDKMAAELAALKAAKAPVPVIVTADTDFSDLQPGAIIQFNDSPGVIIAEAISEVDLNEQWTPEQQAELAAMGAAPLEFNTIQATPTDFKIRRAALAYADQFTALARKVELCGFTAFASDLLSVASLLRDGSHDAAIANAEHDLLIAADNDLADATVRAVEALQGELEAA